MSFSMIEREIALATTVEVTKDTLQVDLTDGRTISVPTTWYPRLEHSDAAEHSKWRLIGHGEGIHWPDLDEDISVADLLLGKPSAESQPSLKRWISSRKRQAA